MQGDQTFELEARRHGSLITKNSKYLCLIYSKIFELNQLSRLRLNQKLFLKFKNFEKNFKFYKSIISGSILMGFQYKLSILKYTNGARQTFNFKNLKRREEESCRNFFQLLDHRITLCHFQSGTIAEGQFSFRFKITLPERLPGSFLFRQNLIGGDGNMKAKIRYSLQSLLLADDQRILGKYSKRLFLAQLPDQPRISFTEQHELPAPTLCCSGTPRGTNKIWASFQRNFYTTDEAITVKIQIDNSGCDAVCEKVILSLVKVIECSGSNSRIFKSQQQIARAEIEGLPPRQRTDGYSKSVKLALSDRFLEFDGLRDHKKRYFKPEDSEFARWIQPSTRGQSIECSYKLIVTRQFDGAWYRFEDLAGIEAPITINPCPSQAFGHKVLPLPEWWNPHYINCEQVELTIERPLNRHENPYTRRRSYHRSDIEYVYDDQEDVGANRINERRLLAQNAMLL